jgi:type I restriction enzyme S subunit
MKSLWENKTIKEILSLEYGKPLPKNERDENGLYPVYGANGVIDRTNRWFYDAQTIIVGRKGSAGNITLTDNRFWPLDVTYFAKFDNHTVDTKFLYYLFTQLNLQRYAKGIKPGINRNEIYALHVSIPPLSEQKRIVAILDQAFAAIDTIKSNTEKILIHKNELLHTFYKNIILSIKNYSELKNLGSVCNLMTGGTPSKNKSEYFKGGDIKWLVSGDIHKKEIFDCSGRITSEGLNNSNAKYLPINSVLIALNGQGKTRGTVAMLRTIATCNQSLVSIYPKNLRELLPEYIFINLHMRYEEIRKITGDSGNDRRGLNIPIIKNIVIPIPSMEDQEIIVTKFNYIYAEIYRLDGIYKTKLAALDELKQSFLQKAFNGEL